MGCASTIETRNSRLAGVKWDSNQHRRGAIVRHHQRRSHSVREPDLVIYHIKNNNPHNICWNCALDVQDGMWATRDRAPPMCGVCKPIRAQGHNFIIGIGS